MFTFGVGSHESLSFFFRSSVTILTRTPCARAAISCRCCSWDRRSRFPRRRVRKLRQRGNKAEVLANNHEGCALLILERIRGRV